MPKATLYKDIPQLLTLKGARLKQGRGSMTEKDLSVIKKASLYVNEHGKVEWVGKESLGLRRFPKARRVSLNGNVFPGWVDAHTHSVFGGDRRDEFELRQTGVSYQEIARQGGGVLSTVRATRRANKRLLSTLLHHRLDEFLKQGVTTVEVKSGYGLSGSQEIKLLEVIRETIHPMTTVSTFLGPHAVSPEARNSKDMLKRMEKVLHQVAERGLSCRADLFVETGYFDLKDSLSYLQLAQSLGFDLAVHADQLSRSGASRKLSQLGARSVDHAIHLTPKDIQVIAESETTCVLLPVADFYIDCPYPQARSLLAAGARVALASDFNPGSSPTQSLSFLGLLARKKMSMSLPEVIVSLTLSGAYALGLESSKGSLTIGQDADFFVTPSSWKDLFYDLSPLRPQSVYIGGKKVH